MLHSQKGKEKKKKKPQGAASQRKKPASFIKSSTFIKPSRGAGRYQPPATAPRPQTPKHPNSSSWHSSSARSSVPPRGLLSSENADRSLIQREAPASLHPHPAPAPPPHYLQAAALMLPDFSRTAMQPDALRLLGVGVGGLSVHFPQSETCKACISSWPTLKPSGCTCLCHLTLPGTLGGITSQIFPFKLLPAPSSPPEKLRRTSLLAGSQTSRDCKAPQLSVPPPPIPTREPQHLAPGRASS